MAVSGISNYQNALYQWSGQKLNSTGSGSSSASSSLSSIFSGSSMTSQISSMVELTKYAMDAMGVSSDSRVTFNQITKYRNQLQSEFNAAVKNGFADSGISDINALTFTLDKTGALSVSGGTADDRKKAQAWLDANPSYGENLMNAIKKADIDLTDSVSFTISSTGKMTVINNDTKTMQSWLNSNADLINKLITSLEEAGFNVPYPLEMSFNDDNQLLIKGDSEEIKKINEWLSENTSFSDSLKKELEKNSMDLSSVTLRLNKDGKAQININNALLNDVQEVLSADTDTGSKIRAGLSSLAIDPNISFTIQIDADGKLNIISDHPDRDKVQKFFEDNPELIKKYRQIETLAGIDDARKAMQISPTSMRKRIQIESMAAWWWSGSSANSYFGNYYDGSMSLLSGLNMNV